MATTDPQERKQPPAPPPGKKRRRGKRGSKRAQVDLNVKDVDTSPSSVDKRRELESGPGAPGVPVVVNSDEPADGKTSAANDDQILFEDDGFDIIWAVEDSMVLETSDDEEARRVHIDRLWQLAAVVADPDDEEEEEDEELHQRGGRFAASSNRYR